MAMKVFIVVLAALTVVSANEKVKRQSGGPDFSEYFNQFQEQLKPITGNLPSFPNGFGSFPSFPEVTGSFPTIPGIPSIPGIPGKREITQESMQEFLNKLQENANSFTNFKPGFPGLFPTPGSSSGSNENSGNERY